MSIHCLFLPFIINWIITNIVYTTNVIVAKFKLKILDIENGIDMIGDTPRGRDRLRVSSARDICRQSDNATARSCSPLSRSYPPGSAG